MSLLLALDPALTSSPRSSVLTQRVSTLRVVTVKVRDASHSPARRRAGILGPLMTPDPRAPPVPGASTTSPTGRGDGRHGPLLPAGGARPRGRAGRAGQALRPVHLERLERIRDLQGRGLLARRDPDAARRGPQHLVDGIFADRGEAPVYTLDELVERAGIDRRALRGAAAAAACCATRPSTGATRTTTRTSSCCARMAELRRDGPADEGARSSWAGSTPRASRRSRREVLDLFSHRRRAWRGNPASSRRSGRRGVATATEICSR